MIDLKHLLKYCFKVIVIYLKHCYVHIVRVAYGQLNVNQIIFVNQPTAIALIVASDSSAGWLKFHACWYLKPV